MRGPLKSLLLLTSVNLSVSGVLVASDADDTVAASATFLSPSKAPVNTGDFWIVEDEPVSTPACLDEDFGFCIATPVDECMDQYNGFGGALLWGDLGIVIGASEYAGCDKYEYEDKVHDRYQLNLYDFDAVLTQALITPEQQPLPSWFNLFGHTAQGDPRLVISGTNEGDELYKRMVAPYYFWNFRDNPPESGLYYLVKSPDGTTSQNPKHSIISTQDYVFLLMEESGVLKVCRYPIPVGGKKDNPAFSGPGITRFFEPDLTATDPNLSNLEFYGEGDPNDAGGRFILSDDRRLFLLRLDTLTVSPYTYDITLVQFDEDLNVIQTWDFSGESFDMGTSLSGQEYRRAIAANRIVIKNDVPIRLYELNPDGTWDIVHEWTTFGGATGMPQSVEAITDSDGLVTARYRDQDFWFINFKGTPDYTP